MSNLQVLKNRVFKLERLEAKQRAASLICTCRVETDYHDANCLESVLKAQANFACEVHGIRDLGPLVWIPDGMPLIRDDRKFCVCPPNSGRTWAEGGPKPAFAQTQA